MKDEIERDFLLKTSKFSSKLISSKIVSDSVTPWTVAYQAPVSMGFSRQEYWSGVPLSGYHPQSTLVITKLVFICLYMDKTPYVQLTISVSDI